MASIYNHNLKVYSEKPICEGYNHSNDLQLPEKEILSIIGPSIINKKVLDIGIGTGRTTKFLLKYSNDYIGIDYSEGMIENAKIKFPDTELVQMDARNLKFPGQTFDLVFFSFNGIDYMNHEDRIQCFMEMTRVLKANGYLVFSTHNLSYSNFNKFIINAPKLSWDYLKRFLKGGKNRLKNMSKHVHTGEYSIITDPGHDFDCLTYYTTFKTQLSQLNSFGFKNIQVFALDGCLVNNQNVNKSAWLYYLMQK